MLNNLDEIARILPKLSPRPWKIGEQLAEGHVIVDAHGEEVGAVWDQDDLALSVAAPQIIEMLLHENHRLRKLVAQKQRTQGFFSREHSRP